MIQGSWTDKARRPLVLFVFGSIMVIVALLYIQEKSMALADTLVIEQVIMDSY